jgi:hypothetical protein
MPNAHTHLAAASEVLARPDFTAAVSWLTGEAERAAFLLGSISPDVRAVSGQPREETHFFTIPSPPDHRAVPAMMAAWPTLADASHLDHAQAAFIAGYITHLIMDELWVDDIVMEYIYVDAEPWGTHHSGWWLYSLLMTYLEYQAAPTLPADTAQMLKRAQPHDWLPFVKDRDLKRWRSIIAKMITTDGARRTSVLFAHSNNITPKKLEAIVTSEDDMAREAWSIVPRARIDGFRALAVERSLEAVQNYLIGANQPSR